MGNMMNLTKLVVVAGFVFAPSAFGKTMQCNKKQTQCVVDGHTDLSIGDPVGVFNKYGELVAHGEIKAMKGDRRAIRVNDRHGRIKKSDKLALLQTRPSDPEFVSTYKVFKRPARMSVGAGMGLATVGIGDGSPGTEFQGFAQWRKWKDIELLGRVSYIAVEGQVARTYEEIELQPVSVSGFGLLGGVGYTLRKNKPLSFRGELGLGTMYVSANVNGDPALVSGHDFDTKVQNGFGGYGRGTVGAVWNMDQYHIQFDISQSLFHDAMASTIGAGLMVDLK